jgi:hypothetical protein
MDYLNKESFPRKFILLHTFIDLLQFYIDSEKQETFALAFHSILLNGPTFTIISQRQNCHKISTFVTQTPTEIAWEKLKESQQSGILKKLCLLPYKKTLKHDQNVAQRKAFYFLKIS